METKELDSSDKLSLSLEDITKIQSENSRGSRGRGRGNSRDRYGSSGFHSRNPYHDKSFVHKGGSDTRVYVSNLDYRTSWQDLKDHMKKSGNVVFADIFFDDDGKSKGCGLVEYSTREEAQLAIKQLNDTKIDNTDRLIFVREDRESPNNNNSNINNRSTNYNSNYSNNRSGDRKVRAYNNDRSSNTDSLKDKKISRQIYVGNLSYHTSWQDLKDHFRCCGKIVRADILIGQDGRPKGSGTILFEHKWEAIKACETMNETEFQGRTIYVNEDKFSTSY